MTSSTPSLQNAAIQGQIVNLVRTGRAHTRPALEQESGFGRKVVAQRVQQAIDADFLEDSAFAPSGGGRPSRLLHFNARVGHVFAGVIASTEMTAAVATLDGTLVASLHAEWDVAVGPEKTLEQLDRLFVRLARKTRTEPWAFGIGVSGPVEFSTGQLVAPPIMPGWDGYSVRSWFRERYDAPVWVDNDVNLMALGEWHQGVPRDGRDLLYILIDTGVGAGLVSRGTVFRGDSGSAGDIGHIQVTDDPTVVCRCGQRGCLEAVTGGWGLVQQLTPRVAESPLLAARMAETGWITAEDIGMATRAGDPLATEVVLHGARVVGVTVANLVNFVNPGTVVFGGGAMRIGEQVMKVLEDTVRGRTTKLAARHLNVRAASLDFREGVTGAAIMAIEHLFEPSSVGLWIENGSPIGHAARLQKAAMV